MLIDSALQKRKDFSLNKKEALALQEWNYSKTLIFLESKDNLQNWDYLTDSTHEFVGDTLLLKIQTRNIWGPVVRSGIRSALRL